MRAGALRHQIWVKSPTITTDDNAEVTTTWGTVMVCWAAIEPLRGREWFSSGMENSDITARGWIRYYDGIEPTMQVYFGSRTFEIVSVVDAGERNRELELRLRELVHT